MERAAPQELSQKRSRRQIIIRYTLEVFQELKQPVSLSIFLAILRNLLQQRLCLRLNHSQFIKHRRIEHRIGRKKGQLLLPAAACPSFDWLHPTRRETVAVGNIGGPSGKNQLLACP